MAINTRRTATAVVRFSHGGVRILSITSNFYSGFTTRCPFTGKRTVVRYWYTDHRQRRIYMEWGEDIQPTPPPASPPISA